MNSLKDNRDRDSQGKEGDYASGRERLCSQVNQTAV